MCGCTGTIVCLLVTLPASSDFFAHLQGGWVVTKRGLLGPPGYHDCVQSIRVLERIAEWTADGITWEGDPRQQNTSGSRTE